MTGIADNQADSLSGSKPSTLTQTSLEHAQGGDAAAWSQITVKYFPMVYAWCRQTGLQPADAADVTQDVFRGIFQGLSSFQRESKNATFRGWIRRITQRRIFDFRKRRARQGTGRGGSVAQAQLLELTDSLAHEDSHPKQNNSRLMKTVLEIQGEFEATTWQAFIRTAVDGSAAVDVAKELGLSVNAVYVAKSRVLKRLRTALEFDHPGNRPIFDSQG